MEHTLWGHLPLLVRANSHESVEFILQSLWITRKTGLAAADRLLIRNMLQLQNDSDLDPLLVCLRILIRKCVYENMSKDEIQKLFPEEVLPELKRLLTLLLQKFQKEWQDEVFKDQITFPQLKAMTWNLANQAAEQSEPVAVINLKLQNDSQPLPREGEVKFQLAKDALDTMLKSMYCIRDQLSKECDIDERYMSLMFDEDEGEDDSGAFAEDLGFGLSERGRRTGKEEGVRKITEIENLQLDGN